MIELCEWMGRHCGLLSTLGGPAVKNEGNNAWEFNDTRINSGMEFLGEVSLKQVCQGKSGGFPDEDCQLILLALLWNCEEHVPGVVDEEFLSTCKYT